MADTEEEITNCQMLPAAPGTEALFLEPERGTMVIALVQPVIGWIRDDSKTGGNMGLFPLMHFNPEDRFDHRQMAIRHPSGAVTYRWHEKSYTSADALLADKNVLKDVRKFTSR